MGNTIRRKPISFNIPSGPNYKFQNIVNFGGLEISDNIFNVDNNTASDMLNVYIDESNSLTTRPRLEQLYDAKEKIIKDWNDLIGIYSIKNGFLIHGHDKDNITTMVKLIPAVSITYITGILPNNKCRIIEQGDNIYLLDGENYYVIKNNTCKYVSDTAYIPTLTVGNVLNVTQGVEDEPVNILSDFYNESYRWDGISNTIPQDGVKTANDAYKPVLDDTYDYIQMYDNGLFFAKNEDDYLLFGKINLKTKKLDYLKTTTITITSDDMFGAALLSPRIAIYKKDTDTVIYYEGVDKNTTGSVDELAQYSFNSASVTKSKMGVSTKGFIVWVKADTPNPSNDAFSVYSLSLVKWSTGYSFSFNNYGGFGSEDAFIDLFINDDLRNNAGMSYHIMLDGVYEADNNKYRIGIRRIDDDMYHFEDYTYVDSEYNNYLYGFNKNSFWILFRSGMFNPGKNELTIYNDYNIEGKKSLNISTSLYIGTFNLTSDNKTAWFNGSNIGTYIIPDVINSPNEYYDSKLTSAPQIVGGQQSNTGYLYDDVVYYEPGKMIVGYKPGLNARAPNLSIGIYQGYEYDNVIVTRNIKTHRNYTKIIELRNKFLKSNLTTRFDNNNWFGSGNYIFRTRNNNPTYIDYSWWTDIGDSNDNITGFNVVQNTVLIVYKKNKLWTIHLSELSENFIDYIITESKNTIGNDALNAPIITTLTELPLQIAYDGIYALTQLTNVQSTDRISTLISEKINKKWQSEKSEHIDNALTLNRLYWTYIILKDKKITKIYLLDNRTNNWFYWELPITCIMATVKENTIVFADDNGKFYKLTTTDIINPYNKDLTEYYDNDRLIIEWKWKSQILPLGTMNYSKKLIETTFIMSDNDNKIDSYGLNYKFYSYKQIPNETNTVSISDKLLYVQSVTKRTLVPRCNFIQIELNNIENDYDNNKLRLIGLGLKYVLLERLT